jgi:hypothetical protein
MTPRWPRLHVSLVAAHETHQPAIGSWLEKVWPVLEESVRQRGGACEVNLPAPPSWYLSSICRRRQKGREPEGHVYPAWSNGKQHVGYTDSMQLLIWSAPGKQYSLIGSLALTWTVYSQWQLVGPPAALRMCLSKCFERMRVELRWPHLLPN